MPGLCGLPDDPREPSKECDHKGTLITEKFHHYAQCPACGQGFLWGSPNGGGPKTNMWIKSQKNNYHRRDMPGCK
jgi:hypothetical protein